MNKVLITSQGRTATLSISQSLDQLDGVRSFHERLSIDDPDFLYSSQIAKYERGVRAYLRNEDNFANSLATDHYVAVNPYYRFAGALLQEHFGWKVAHIVRHPKTYLESVYVRTTFTKGSGQKYHLPKEDDPFAARWQSATRFEKLCWYYAKTFSYFAASNIKWYKFEALIADVSALNEMLSDLELPNFPADFRLAATNSRPSYKLRLKYLLGLAVKPKALNWEQLSQRELQTYNELFAPLAEHFNYDL